MKELKVHTKLLTLGGGQRMYKLMTYNILVDKPESEHPWNLRRGLLLETIRQEDPDILCVQEALQHQKEYLQTNLPDYEGFGVGRNDGKSSGEQVVVFHKPSRLKELDKGVFWLSETPDTPGSIGWDAKRPRTVIWKKLQTPLGTAFYVLSTHYDHMGKNARRSSAQVIADYIRRWEKAPVLLCGDFNSPAQSEPYQCLLAQGFTDGFTAAGGDFPYTYHRFEVDQYADSECRSQIMLFHDRVFRRIDHIFFQGQFAFPGIWLNTFHLSKMYPSDHFPVIGSFDMQF